MISPEGIRVASILGQGRHFDLSCEAGGQEAQGRSVWMGKGGPSPLIEWLGKSALIGDWTFFNDLRGDLFRWSRRSKRRA